MSKSGVFYVISAPSGAGKTSLVSELVGQMDRLEISVSHTTRAKRPGEVDGEDYYFIKNARFDEMVADNKFIEHAVVYENKYGTSQNWVMDKLAQGIDVVLEIDWQGAMQIRRKFPAAVSIFVLPPSYKALKQRLLTRNDAVTNIEKRMETAKEEVSHYDEFDYVIINDEFAKDLRDIKTIVNAYRVLESFKKHSLRDLLAQLLKN